MEKKQVVGDLSRGSKCVHQLCEASRNTQDKHKCGPQLWPVTTPGSKIFKLIVDKMYPVSYIKSSLTYLGEEDENTNWMRD